MRGRYRRSRPATIQRHHQTLLDGLRDVSRLLEERIRLKQSEIRLLESSRRRIQHEIREAEAFLARHRDTLR